MLTAFTRQTVRELYFFSFVRLLKRRGGGFFHMYIYIIYIYIHIFLNTKIGGFIIQFDEHAYLSTGWFNHQLSTRKATERN